MAQTFPDLRAAAIDGRMQNVFYRQHQLEALHHSIIDHASEIRQALKSDYGYSSAESTVELHLTVETLKRVYGNLEPEKMLADEYAVATGNDAPSNRVPAGIVYIQPSSHSLLFSIVAPLSTAIAAGNCVIILLERNLRVLTSVVRRALSGALHPDIFAFASSIVHDPTILKSAIIVDQDSSERWPNASRLASPSDSCTLAVVDRTADVRLAARELAAASLAFGGSSPYAPDVVLVNEFAKKDFLQALVEETRRVMDQNGLNESQKNELTKGQRVTNEIRSLKEIDPNIRIIIQEPNLVIVEMVRGHVDIVRFKRSIPLLTVYAVKSLDDAIDFVSSANAGPALAAYHFGNGHVGKYLAQFIDARISLVNHILRELLVGPANPAGYAVDPRSRYNVEMFTLPRPTFIRKPATASRLAEVMASTDGTTVRRLLDEALSPMKSMKRKPGGGVGFFEQGFLINAGMILTITVSATIVGSMWLFQRERLSLLGLRLAMKVES